MKRILISNDDGLRAPGLLALAESLSDFAEVLVVAPEHEQSAKSHALSLHHPLRIRDVKTNWWAVDGTPADCVYVAINYLFRDAKPDLVVSGINHGPNLADDVIYSGTVAAAMEGSVSNIPSVAFSLAARRKPFEFSHAAQFAATLVKHLFSIELPRQLLLNVNVPPGVPKGHQFTSLGKHSYGAGVIENVDPRGRKYFWIGGTDYAHHAEAGTDVSCVADDQMISITPLTIDTTHRPYLQQMASWKLES
jgi:5'-nucleotidase